MLGGPVTPDDFAAAVTAITSAFGDPTRRDIYLFVHTADEPVTAAAIAERFDLHPNVARHHLDKLAAGGYLEVDQTRPAHAGAGRPSKRYRATGTEMPSEFPVRRDELMASLLGRALSRLPEAEVEAIATEVGRDYGRALAEAMAPGEGHRTFRAALHAVADALTAHGFAAHTEGRGNQLRIVSEHCPFGGAAVQHPVLCAVDRGMVQGMLAGLYGDTSPATAESRAQGDATCVTSFDAVS